MVRLGRILESDFAWSRNTVDQGLQVQANAAAGTLIGDIFKQLRPTHASDVDQALRLQQLLDRHAREREASRDRRGFLLLEYKESARRLDSYRLSIIKGVLTYGTVFLLLIGYIAYPVNQVLFAGAATTGSVQGTAAEGTFTLVRLYGGLGVVFIFFALVYGLYLVQSYGRFVNEKLRVIKTQALIRDELLGSTSPRSSVMIRWSDLNPEARAQPSPQRQVDMSNMQEMIPLLYTIACMPKFIMLAFFVSAVVDRSIVFKQETLWTVSLFVCVLACAWVWLVAQGCERFHKHVEEGRMVTPSRPRIIFKTDHLRGEVPSLLFKFLYVLSGLMLATAIWNRFVPTNLRLLELMPESPLAHCIGLFACFLAIRVLDTVWRVRSMKPVPP